MTDASPAAIRIHVAGLPIVRADVALTLDLLWADVEGAIPHVYVFVNGYSATLRRQHDYAKVLQSMETIPLPDGASLAWGAWLSGQGRAGRCPGPDFFEAAAARAVQHGTSFYLLGGGSGVVEELARGLKNRHPGLRIAGLATPPFGDWSSDESARMAQAVSVSGADVVWLGVSAPKQEVWAARWAPQIGRPVVCVGAAFDFLSERKPRAPRWMRGGGLEWLFRLMSEPRRVWKRYLVGNVVFMWDLARWGRRSIP